MSRKVGIIVEGESDRRALSKILSRYGLKAEFRLLQGGFNVRKINSLARGLKEAGCDKVVVLRDTEYKSKEERRSELSRKISELAEGVEVCFVRCSLESWLLADEKAVEAVTGVKVKEYSNPELIPNHKEELRRIFKRRGSKLGYTAVSHVPKIVENMNLKKLEAKCLSFKEFLEVIRDY